VSVKRILKYILCVVLCLCLLSSGTTVFAALMTFETQYPHETADIAWLTDLTVKENLQSIGDIVNSLTLVADSDYPYCETAESFRQDVEYYQSVYMLNENSPKAAYIYFFELLGSTSGKVAGEITDADIKSYLKKQGVELPLNEDEQTRIVERAIYAAMVTGTISNFAPGASLDEIAISFITKLTGSGVSTLSGWMPDSEKPTLDEYILAASRYSLWAAGYDVDKNTDESTVYKLVACMTIEKNGITADTASDFNSLKLKFLSAMLGAKYGVSPDWATLGDAVNSDSTALYILRLLGRKNGVSVGTRNLEEAFLFVAQNSHVFDLEVGEFYADIYNYDVWVSQNTSSIWLNPTPYNTDGTVIVTANGIPLKNTYYTQFDLDASAETQLITLEVTSVYGTKTSECTYKLNVHRGEGGPASTSGISNEKLSDSLNKLYLSSETLLAGVITSLNLDTSVAGAIGKAFPDFTAEEKSVLSVIAPTFGSDENAAETVNTDAACKAFLDKIGSVIDSDITGINGLDVLKEKSSSLLDGSLVTFTF